MKTGLGVTTAAHGPEVVARHQMARRTPGCDICSKAMTLLGRDVV